MIFYQYLKSYKTAHLDVTKKQEEQHGIKYGHLRISLLSASWNRFPTTMIRIVRLKCIIICKHPEAINGSGRTSLRYLSLWCVQVNNTMVSNYYLLFYFYYYYYRVEIINNQRKYMTELYTSPKASPYGRISLQRQSFTSDNFCPRPLNIMNPPLFIPPLLHPERPTP